MANINNEKVKIGKNREMALYVTDALIGTSDATNKEPCWEISFAGKQTIC